MLEVFLVQSDRQNSSVSELGIQSQNWESSLKNENPVPELGNESQNWENEGLKPLSDIALASPQTCKKELDPPVQPDGGVAQNNSKCEEVNQSERVEFKNEEVNQNEQVESKNREAQNEGIKTHESTTATEKKEVPRGVFLFQLPKQKIEQLGARLPEIGKQMREQNAAIEKEMATDEYKQKAREMFAKLRAIGKKGGKK